MLDLPLDKFSLYSRGLKKHELRARRSAYSDMTNAIVAVFSKGSKANKEYLQLLESAERET